MKLFIILSAVALILSGCTSNSAAGDSSKVIITAHRGASGHAPENTLSAMKAAMEFNSDFAELDVQETADGKIILLHDKTLKRTAGEDVNIWELNYADLKNYEVGGWFGEKFKGEKIPTLQEVFDLTGGKMKINIELKTNGHQKQLAERTVKIVEENNFIDNVIMTSFDFGEINRVRKANPDIKVGYIFSKLNDSVDVFTADVDLLSVNKKLVDKEFVDKAHANGKEVHVWTVNEEDEMKKLLELGVNSIITNYPDRLNKVLGKK